MNEIKFSRALIFFALGIISILTLPKLFSRGMFMDGTIYSAISINLSEGVGSFWKPFYNGLNAHTFYEHPPLFFWIQAFWFKIIGNHHFTERLFDFFILLITSVLLYKVAQQYISKSLSVLSVLLFILIPKVIWTYDNNMMETILPPLTLGAFLILSKRTIANKWWQLPLVAIITICFMLVKGPVALGILALPLTFIKNTKLINVLKDFLLLVGFTAIFGMILFQYEPAFTNFATYLDQQVLSSINGNRPSEYTTNHFKIITGLLEQLILPFVLIAVILIATRKKPTTNAKLLPLLLAGLLFSLPFSLFKKQHIYYLIPAFPFFAILIASIASLSINKIESLIKKIGLTVIKLTGIALIIVGLTLSIINYNKPMRDVEMISAVHKISDIVGKNKVSVSTELKRSWGLFAYATRFDLVDFNHRSENKFLLSTKNQNFVGYEKLEISIPKYFLYQRID